MATTPTVRRTTAAAAGLATALVLAGCANPTDGGTTEVAATPGGKTTTRINISPDQNRVTTAKVDSIAAEVPERIRKRGTLELVASSGSAAPLTFHATDNKTVIGVEPDLAHLVADVLGLKPRLHTVSWENIFVGLDSGKYDAGLSNITVTEERKEKYDFATYREDNLGFEAKKGSGLEVAGPEDLAGRTVAVSSGTNQEKLLVEWSKENEKAGREPVDIKYYQNDSDTYLALQSGRIDLYLGPNPTAAYHAATTGKTEVVGTYSGAGATLQGLIAATTKKDSGLVEPLAAALNHVIDNGTYAKVLQRWGLSDETVTESRINPPGLPRTNQ
ncbi:putative ABC transporter substrate-binding protein [Streptomyces ambofaciens ATCC 23877]|uniref:Putative ABC transporter substrate-binding protein n=1 Tax=Streptomyces ambofaciens (strain ATCC 23877 / 3486 / DSM 40053 / JCM 4204 / NBRC 12836 / NRRL B-2516) TaxID=278992 RepID=A0ACA7_STRA7|nr:ABC transporter substrate-binding protein [Streptomyces ambofaciens]AKZ60237.1 putative ABC transporter substrate-binding protein [Streptomyces ambofaciens ATCC 23877]CAJ88111.1 putative ABC transporter substrate-binding protein [Streptomyces ambofaciens ATCC 23877]